MSTPDARTTPPALRIPVLLGLALWAGYFALCATASLQKDVSPWLIQGRWQMFTVRNDRFTHVEAEIQREGEWTPIVLSALFPTRWESGPRYEGFEEKAGYAKVLAAAVCTRSPDRPDRVRLYAVREKLQVGVARPKRDKRSKLLDWDCADTVHLPAGVRL